MPLEGLPPPRGLPPPPKEQDGYEMLDGEKGEEIVKTLIEWCGKKGEKTIVQLQDVRNKVGPGHIQNQGKSYVLVQKSDLRKHMDRLPEVMAEWLTKSEIPEELIIEEDDVRVRAREE